MEQAGVVVVTGCGQGIGQAALKRMLVDGHLVVGLEIDPDLAAATRDLLGSRGRVVVGDAASQTDLGAVATTVRELGQLIGWVNNAGVDLPTNLHTPDAGAVARVFHVNIYGCYWGCATAIACFRGGRGPGSIVNVSSVHGRASFTNSAAYDASKAAIDGITRYVAVEYGSSGIRANAVAPGAVRTPLHAAYVADSEDPVALESTVARVHPLNRIAEPHEIASVISFLLSSDASFVSGQSLAVDGGLTARCAADAIQPGFGPALEEKKAARGEERIWAPLEGQNE
jgi:NAD(P)-dependent dehydrogenase (short-subunit alcohol dehydrogenase family)